MSVENQNNQVESGWKTETEEHRHQITRFLQEYLGTPFEQRPQYDIFTELHFSGENSTVLRQIAEGGAKIIAVKTLYEGGKPSQIHVVFDSENAGHNIDVYLTKKALSDYLGETNEHEG